MIKRFSKPWWISLASGSCLFGLLTYGVLRAFGAVDDDHLVLYLLTGIAMGDALLAISLEVITPTQVTLRPGERRTSSCNLDETAEVLSGFQHAHSGRVTVRGESWAARMVDEHPVHLTPGSVVRVVGREGLTLLIATPSRQD
ncbi:MAG: NfeD family protein [Gammaproteobacteria bacterium]|jgi:membrane protein implicated in regulation of membrane protease activity